MTVGGISGKYPIYDQWSNEGGGRALEDQRRYGDRMLIKSYEEQSGRRLKTLGDRAHATETEFLRQQSAFVERYGVSALSQLAGDGRDAFLKGIPADEVKQLLNDLSALEAAGAVHKRSVDVLEFMKEHSDRSIAGFKESANLSASSYDARFLRDDEARLAAYNRMEAAQQRLSELGNSGRGSAAAFMAGKIAETASLKERLGPPSALYSVNSIGAIEIDFKALEKMGPGEAATSELARLIGVLAERNGLGQLRDGLIAIVNGQNRRLAER